MKALAQGIGQWDLSAKKRLLLRCIHHFKSDLINNMDHMRISGTEPSSVILSQKSSFKTTITLNMVIFAGGKFHENVGKTFHVGVIFTILILFNSSTHLYRMWVIFVKTKARKLPPTRKVPPLQYVKYEHKVMTLTSLVMNINYVKHHLQQS